MEQSLNNSLIASTLKDLRDAFANYEAVKTLYHGSNVIQDQDFVEQLMAQFLRFGPTERLVKYMQTEIANWNNQAELQENTYRHLQIFNKLKQEYGKNPTKSILLICANADYADNIMDAIQLLFMLNENYIDFNFYVCNGSDYNKNVLFNALVPENHIIKEHFTIKTNLIGEPYDIIVFQRCPLDVFNEHIANNITVKLKDGRGMIIIHPPGSRHHTLNHLYDENFLKVIQTKATSQSQIVLAGAFVAGISTQTYIPPPSYQKIIHVYKIGGTVGGGHQNVKSINTHARRKKTSKRRSKKRSGGNKRYSK